MKFQKGDYVILVDPGPIGEISRCSSAEGMLAKVCGYNTSGEFVLIRWLDQKKGHGGYLPRRFELMPGPW